MDINNIVNSTRTRNARLLDDINNKILNREYYKFKYLPFEGALPGLYFQQQTEDAINDIGNVAYATEQVADEALKIAQQAYNIALAALETANNALAAAQTAQQTADTALNIANNALSVGTAAATAAAAAQNRADEAYDLADAAQKAADAAQNTADAAQKAANSAANDATNALTKAEDALTKIEQLSVLNYYNNLTEATDVNTLVDIHRWYLQASNNPNAPETNPGFLNVDNDYNDSVCKQLWVSETTGAIYNRFGQIVENSNPATVSSWSEWYKLATKADIDGTTKDLTEKITTVANTLATHEADVNNPHKVTAEQLGLTTVYRYKGSVETYADLPTTGQKVGDVWNVETADPDHGIKAGDNVAWDGAQWDILGGNHDLSGYAQLNAANTFTAANTFNSNIVVRTATAAGSAGVITLGEKPSSKTAQCLINAAGNGNLILQASENGIVALQSGSVLQWSVISDEANKKTSAYLHSNLAATYTPATGVVWEGNANTATKLATACTINGVPFDGTKNITIEAEQGKFLPLTGGTVTGPIYLPSDTPTTDTQAVTKKYVDDSVAGAGGGYAQLNAANTFTAANTFNSNIVVRTATAAGSAGVITLGEKPSSKTAQCLINAAGNGNLILQASENGIVALQSGSVLQWSVISDEANKKTSAYLHSNLAATYTPATGVVWEGNANTATKLATACTINGVPFDGTKNITIEAEQGKFLPLTGGTVTGDVKVATRLYVGGQGGPGDGVISSDNGEKCLYFCGTAENTYYSTPNTGNTINYQSAANCYLINCSINNPSSLNMNFSNMNFKATVGSVPYMCKTLTFWLPVSATVPAVTWTFPTGSAVYYPKGVAPTLKANANNIINVIAVVDDTGSFSIQVCDTVVLPYSG